jgi:hypothetical protein
MSKQVEVPESAVEALRDAEWAYSCSPVGPDRDSVEWAEMRLQAVLPLIYKHFSDRLLSDEAVGAMFEVLHPRSNCGWKGLTREQRDYWRRGLEAAALQAASMPEGASPKDSGATV